MAASTCSPPDVRLPVEPRGLVDGSPTRRATPADAECFGSAPGLSSGVDGGRLGSFESVRVAGCGEGAPSALAEIEHEAAESVVSAEDTKVDPALEDVPVHVPRLTHAKLSWSDIMRGDIIDDTDEAVPTIVEALPPLPDEPTPGSSPAPKNLAARLLSCWTCDGKSLSCLRAGPPCSGRPKAR